MNDKPAKTGDQPDPNNQRRPGAGGANQKSGPGVGSSPGQAGGTGSEEAAPAWPSAGTPDIERASNETQDSGTDGSMVNESTGAYKERP